MANAESKRIIPVSNPTEVEIGQILALKNLCEQRLGIDILLSGDFLRSLDKPGVGAFEIVKESGVIGFAYFYSFFKEEAEAMILAAPDGDWHGICSSLLAATISECERRGHVRLLIMNDRRFGEGAKLLVNAGCKFAFSEHRMENTGNPMPPVQNVALCKVSNDDRKLRDVELACFGKFHSKLGQSRYLAVSEGIPVGKVDVNLEDGIAELTGFCVVPDLRKRGFGKSILSGIVDLLIEQGQERIFLDVQTDNDIALELYLKANFRKIFTIDYYQMPLERKNTS